ncbi:hypothetical protein ACHQM5_013393 [Ranunculus cassubicifolius]
MSIASIQNMRITCSTMKRKMTPVYICIHRLPTTVTTNMVRAPMLAKDSGSLLIPIVGMKKPMPVQIIAVLVILDNWS